MILLRHQIRKIRIHRPQVIYRIRCGFSFYSLRRADSEISGFAAELAGCVKTKSVYIREEKNCG